MTALNLATKEYTDTLNAATASTAADAAALLVLNKIYPVGSIVFGTHPEVGTWERYDFGGVIYSDSTLEAGQTLTEALPNITGSASKPFFTQNGGTSTNGAITVSDSGVWGSVTGMENHWHYLSFDASKSNPTYGAATQTGYTVQMKGTNVIAYKRTA